MMVITRRLRAVVALMLGAILSGLMALVCYVTYPWPSIATPWQISFSSMRKWQSALDAYKLQHGEFPDQLLASATIDFRSYDNEDGWKHPFDYQRLGNGYRLRCLGSDGQPGGTGLRADFGPDETIDQLPKSSFLEFLQKDFPLHMAAVCFIAGLLACLMLLTKTMPASITPRQFLVTVIKTGITSVVVGTGILLFCMASNH